MELDGRVALVTGAGRRLGRAMAEALAARGMAVGIHYHASRGGAETLRDAIRGAGGTAECFAADLADPAAAERLPGEVATLLGRLDVLVNSAAIMRRVPVGELSPAAWNQTLDLNARAPYFCAQGAVAALRATRGAIVNIADLSGLEPWPNYPAHSVSKAGVIMLTKVLARALAPDIRVNAIAPGTVLVADECDAVTRAALAEAAPLRRLGTPRDAVNALLYLLEGGDFVTGEVLVVDGGRVLR